MPGAHHATLTNAILLGGRPATLGHRLTGQMKDRIDPLEGLRRRWPLHGVPAMDRTGQGSDRLGRPLGVPREHHRSIQQPEKTWSDEAGAAREQMRLHGLESQLKQAEVDNLRHERALRDRLLREALDPQIEQAKEILLQAQASLMRVASEIFDVLESGGDVSPATMGSWNRRLESLAVLAKGSIPLEEALAKLKGLKEDTKAQGSLSPDALKEASTKVERAFTELERRAAQELHADQIWQLMRGGRGEEALQRIAEIRARASNNLGEVDALWKLVSGIAARNEMLAEHSAQTVDAEKTQIPQEVLHG